jgi:hypothetical protein
MFLKRIVLLLSSLALFNPVILVSFPTGDEITLKESEYGI